MAFGLGGLVAGHYSLKGGAGAPSCLGNVASGAGGAGRLLKFSFGLTPPVTAANATNNSLASVTISSSETLTANLVAGSVTVNSGVVLTTNGFSIIVSGTFDNLGTVTTGLATAANYPLSFGGSGGGSQSLNYAASDSNGSSTQAAGGAYSASNSANGGNGATPAGPTLNDSVISGWYSGGLTPFLTGAGGGALTGIVAPGEGAYGLYIQASTLVAGSLDATGQNGGGTCSGYGLSGGGGGGVIILAYGSGGLSTGTYSVSGGVGAPSCNGSVYSGSGGAGAVYTFAYGASAPIPANATSSSSSTIVIAASEVLSSDLIASDVTIDPGVTLTTNGHSLIVSGVFDNLGTIATGLAPLAGYTSSYGGSGGGSQSLNYAAQDNNGDSTLAPGGAYSSSNSANGSAGSTPSAPSLSASVVRGWYLGGMSNFLNGAGGGNITGYELAGSGGFGLFIEAGTLVEGVISSAGQVGSGTCSGVGLAGGGGGGAVLLVYGTGGLVPGSVSDAGGAGVPSCNGVVSSGGGGSGQVLSMAYAGAPPVQIVAPTPRGQVEARSNATTAVLNLPAGTYHYTVAASCGSASPSNGTLVVGTAPMTEPVYFGCSPLPKIKSVAFAGSSSNYTVTIHGAGFGAPPVALPFYGVTSYLRVGDAAQVGHGESGYTTDLKKLHYQKWNSTFVRVSGLKAAAGDAITIAVWNPQNNESAAWGGDVPTASSGAPVIRTVIFSGSGSNLSINIYGKNFGPGPNRSLPFLGDLNFLLLTDWRGHCNFNSYQFNAGFTGWGVTGAAGVTLLFAAWNNTHIRLAGFGGTYGQGCAFVAVGDPITVDVWPTTDLNASGLQTAWGGRVA